MEENIAATLDKRIQRLGYKSRSEFFTAIAYTILYGTTGNENYPESLKEWLKDNTTPLSEDQIKQRLIEIIRETYHPVIAMKGTQIAIRATGNDLRKTFHDETTIWLTESDIREAYHAYTLIHRKELEEHRNTQLNGENT